MTTAKRPKRPPTPKQFAKAQKDFGKQFEILRRAYFHQVGVFAMNSIEQAKGIPDDETRHGDAVNHTRNGAIVSYAHAYVANSPWANVEAQAALILLFSRHVHAAAVRLPEGLAVPPEHGGPAISFQAMAIAAAVEDILEAVAAAGGPTLSKVEADPLVKVPEDFWTQIIEGVPPEKAHRIRGQARRKRKPRTT